MAANWFAKCGGAQYGPLTSAQLKRLADGGKVLPDSLVRRGESGTWVPAQKVKGLFSASSGAAVGAAGPCQETDGLAWVSSSTGNGGTSRQNPESSVPLESRPELPDSYRIVCPRCGEPFASGAIVCAGCAYNLATAQVQTTSPLERTPAEQTAGGDASFGLAGSAARAPWDTAASVRASATRDRRDLDSLDRDARPGILSPKILQIVAGLFALLAVAGIGAVAAWYMWAPYVYTVDDDILGPGSGVTVNIYRGYVSGKPLQAVEVQTSTGPVYEQSSLNRVQSIIREKPSSDAVPIARVVWEAESGITLVEYRGRTVAPAAPEERKRRERIAELRQQERQKYLSDMAKEEFVYVANYFKGGSRVIGGDIELPSISVIIFVSDSTVEGGRGRRLEDLQINMGSEQSGNVRQGDFYVTWDRTQGVTSVECFGKPATAIAGN